LPFASYRRATARVRQLIHDLQAFWRSELWQMDPGTLPQSRKLLLRICRILDLVGRGLQRNDLRVHASGLTYMTLMSLVPFIAIGIWIFRALGLHLQFVEETKAYLKDFPPHFTTLFDQTMTLVDQTNFAQLGLVGATVLVLTAFGLLGKMESVFNKIWGIEKSRSILRRWSNYLSITVLIPILLFITITLITRTLLQYSFLAKALVLWATWVAFSFIYTQLPNTRVKLLASTAGGLVAACLWQLWLVIFIIVQPGVTRYNLIYGTLAFVPVFLAWLYVGWMIILLGGEIACAIHNEKSFQLHREGGQISLATRIGIALAIMVRASRAFNGTDNPLEANDFSHEHQVPYRTLQETLGKLVQGGFLIRSEDHEDLYVVRKNPNQIFAKDIVDLFLHDGRSILDLELKSYHRILAPLTEALNAHMETNLGNLSLTTMAAEFRD